VDNLHCAAVEAVKEARERKQFRFSVGLDRVVPEEWGLEEGMGSCGLSALVVRLESGRTCAYVVLDGNNIRSGLRERIIEALKPEIVDDAEVITSDTHMVNAIGATTRGYAPIGERTDDQRLTEYVVSTVKAAGSKLVRARTSYARTMVRGLTVLGEAGLNLLSDILESAFSLFKKVALLTTSLSLLASVIVIFFI
jgi:putative membrane protein